MPLSQSSQLCHKQLATNSVTSIRETQRSHCIDTSSDISLTVRQSATSNSLRRHSLISPFPRAAPFHTSSHVYPLEPLRVTPASMLLSVTVQNPPSGGTWNGHTMSRHAQFVTSWVATTQALSAPTPWNTPWSLFLWWAATYTSDDHLQQPPPHLDKTQGNAWHKKAVWPAPLGTPSLNFRHYSSWKAIWATCWAALTPSLMSVWHLKHTVQVLTLAFLPMHLLNRKYAGINF